MPDKGVCESYISSPGFLERIAERFSDGDFITTIDAPLIVSECMEVMRKSPLSEAELIVLTSAIVDRIKEQHQHRLYIF